MASKPKISHDAKASDVCEALDLSASSLRRYVDAGMPCQGKGRARRFNLGECVAWMQAQGKTGTVGRPSDPSNDELLALKIKKEALLIRRYQRECEVAERALIPIDVARADLRWIAAMCKTHFYQLPYRVASMHQLALGNAEAAHVDGLIRGALDDCFRQISERLQTYDREVDNEQNECLDRA